MNYIHRIDYISHDALLSHLDRVHVKLEIYLKLQHNKPVMLEKWSEVQ